MLIAQREKWEKTNSVRYRTIKAGVHLIYYGKGELQVLWNIRGRQLQTRENEGKMKILLQKEEKAS